MSILKSIERSGRSRGRGFLRRLISPGAAGGELPLIPDRLLVVRTDSRLGNLVLMEPLLAGLRTRFPDCELHVLTSHVFAGLLESQGYRVIAVDKKGQITRPWKFTRLVDDLRSVRYDAVLDASHPHSFSLSSAVTGFLSGAPCRIGFDSGGGGDWYSHTVPEPPLTVHESRAMHSLGGLWPDWPEWRPPKLVPGHTEKRCSIGVHVGASGRKAFPLEYFMKLVGVLTSRVQVEVYCGGPDERVRAESLRAAHGVRVMPLMDLGGLLDSLAGLDGLVTPDNGPMHAASALGVPVTGLFRVDNAERFRPLSPGSEVLLDPDAAEPERAAEMILRSSGRG